MRCILCETLSIKIICKYCIAKFIEPIFKKRELSDGFYVYSFFEYEQIKELINKKYYFYGDKVFRIMAKQSFEIFSNNFFYLKQLNTIPIDDHTRHGFSQSAILVNSLKSKYFKPVYSTLKAKNIVKYAGKDLKYRLENKRNFKYTGNKNLQVVLVDDLVTTGLTILEAKKCLEQYDCEVLFALTLSDTKI